MNSRKLYMISMVLVIASLVLSACGARRPVPTAVPNASAYDRCTDPGAHAGSSYASAHVSATHRRVHASADRGGQS